MSIARERSGGRPPTISQLWAMKDELTTLPGPQLLAAFDVIHDFIDTKLNTGRIRVAEFKPDGSISVNEEAKQAILMLFPIAPMTEGQTGPFYWRDKVPPKLDFVDGVRIVPGSYVRWGSHLEPGVVVMPNSHINIGAFVGKNTMVDTATTVGSCAQIGANVHLSGGVGIGGVLEPAQAAPVMIGDNAFIGARSEVAEGCVVEEGAVLSMGCYMGQSTKIYDARSGELLKPGRIPARAVVVPGTLPSEDGTHGTYALIIKKTRDEGTDAKVALNEALR